MTNDLSRVIKIVASTPPAIGIALGSVGMMTGLPNAAFIFGISVLLQIFWIVAMAK